MKFTIDNQPPPSSSRPSVLKCVSIIKKLPDGALKTTPAVARLAGIAVDTIRCFGTEVPPEFTVKERGIRLYGNAKTIAAWKARGQTKVPD